MIAKKRIYILLSLATIISMLILSGCQASDQTETAEYESTEDLIVVVTQESESVSETEAVTIEYETLTDVGTYRAETLIVDQGYGVASNPDNLSPFFPSTTSALAGLLQLNVSYLWEIDTVTGEQFPAMAAEPLTALDDTYTSWEIVLREGIYWSDDVEVTAEDVAYTFQLFFENPTFTYSAAVTALIKEGSVEVIDRYTVHFETNVSYPRLQEVLGVKQVSSVFIVVPKHIWENVDPTTYENNPPISAGPYTLKDYDPNGSWFLWERRDDWERTAVGMIEGMPAPKYVLFKAYGTEEKRVLAAVDNDLDVLMDISPESWEILQSSNDEAEAWYDGFPYADFDDPCSRGMMLNWAVYPYDIEEVRWALALATDMVSVAQATYDGMLRASVLTVPATETMQETYYSAMLEWLEEFTLDDGYQPFDSDYALKIAEALTESGVEGIPEDEEELKDMFGVGWWNYDVDEAAKLLESVGFTKNEDGQWLLPDGTLWTINILSPVNYETESELLSYAVSESWNDFGIDTVVDGVDVNTWNSLIATGDFEVANHWSGACAVTTDMYTNMDTWHMDYVTEIGESTSNNYNRVDSEEISAILDEMEVTLADDPELVDITIEFLEQMVTEMTWIPMVGTSKFVPVTTHWWDGFPNAEDAYNGPWWWWSCFKYILPHLEETGNL